MGICLQGLFPLKLMRICTHDPTPVGRENSPGDEKPLPGRKEEDMTDVQENTNTKPHRIAEMQIGDTLFTVVSVESSRARECLYDKVKRLILDSDALDMPPAA